MTIPEIANTFDTLNLMVNPTVAPSNPSVAPASSNIVPLDTKESEYQSGEYSSEIDSQISEINPFLEYKKAS